MSQIKILNSQITSSGDITIKAGTVQSSSLLLSSSGFIGLGKFGSEGLVVTGSGRDALLAQQIYVSNTGQVTFPQTQKITIVGDIVLSGSLTIENLGTLSNRDNNSVVDLGGFF